MRIYQTWRDYAVQVALVRDLPVLAGVARRRVVDLHVERYLELSERDEREREPHFRMLFETALDGYVRASKEGYPEANAREITHIQATWHFADLGWAELLEFPPREADDYYARYRDFYDRHGCSPSDPFGEFAPPGGLPDAPETPDRMDGAFPLAEPGLADETYVLAPDLDDRLPGGDVPKGDLDAVSGGAD